jgi:hypothetical protein
MCCHSPTGPAPAFFPGGTLVITLRVVSIVTRG